MLLAPRPLVLLLQLHLLVCLTLLQCAPPRGQPPSNPRLRGPLRAAHGWTHKLAGRPAKITQVREAQAVAPLLPLLILLSAQGCWLLTADLLLPPGQLCRHAGQLSLQLSTAALQLLHARLGARKRCWCTGPLLLEGLQPLQLAQLALSAGEPLLQVLVVCRQRGCLLPRRRQLGLCLAAATLGLHQVVYQGLAAAWHEVCLAQASSSRRQA